MKKIKTKKFSLFLSNVRDALFQDFNLLKIAVADSFLSGSLDIVEELTSCVFRFLEVFDWIRENNPQLPKAENDELRELQLGVSADIAKFVLCGFGSNVLPWHANDPDEKYMKLLLTICIQLNLVHLETHKSLQGMFIIPFDFLALIATESSDYSSNKYLISVPFYIRHLSKALALKAEPRQQWIPLCVRTDHLFRNLCKTIAKCINDYSWSKVDLDCGLIMLTHFALFKSSIRLMPEDLQQEAEMVSAAPTSKLIKSLLKFLSTNSNQPERDAAVSCVDAIIAMFELRSCRVEICESMMTHTAPNIRTYGVYKYKNEIAPDSDDFSVDEAIVNLIFDVTSAFFASPTYQGNILENDDAFFELSPAISQVANFGLFLQRHPKLTVWELLLFSLLIYKLSKLPTAPECPCGNHQKQILLSFKTKSECDACCKA
ncbi:hypothetical protein HDU83_002177 [Entophlyctis luteolus]|nr:hypothetical protein HDU83_002177 [Entophlyctis luteolus]